MGFLAKLPPAQTGSRGGTWNPVEEALCSQNGRVTNLKFCPLSIGMRTGEPDARNLHDRFDEEGGNPAPTRQRASAFSARMHRPLFSQSTSGFRATKKAHEYVMYHVCSGSRK